MKKIDIIGIGYVGLPLARLFSTKYPVIEYDINLERINELNNCKDVLNELSKIFNKLNINEVLKATSTKWNFLNFKPGLVGGHCIGVDPYYLPKKSQDLRYIPKIILAGRKLNDSMGKYVVYQVVKLMIKKKLKLKIQKF